MRKKKLTMLLAGVLILSMLAGCETYSEDLLTEIVGKAVKDAQTRVEEVQAEVTGGVTAETIETEDEDLLVIREQGMFSAGGTVTEPVPGEYDVKTNWQDMTRAGNTMHVDHANVFYQIPANDNGNPIVFLHGAGQSRMGFMTTPDGREGWSDIFLKKGHSVFLVDQPRRGEAGSTSEGPVDTQPGDQAWYTHFRIGRVAPERYEGSQFPEGAEAQDQFFRQMTPNTGEYD